jgi:ribosomal protein S14
MNAPTNGRDDPHRYTNGKHVIARREFRAYATRSGAIGFDRERDMCFAGNVKGTGGRRKKIPSRRAVVFTKEPSARTREDGLRRYSRTVKCVSSCAACGDKQLVVDGPECPVFPRGARISNHGKIWCPRAGEGWNIYARAPLVREINVAIFLGVAL